MAIQAIDLEPYVITLDDDSDPKTEFLVKPFDQFEYMKMASVYQKIMQQYEVQDEGDVNKILDFFGSDEAVQFKNDFYAFLRKGVIEIRNIKDKDGNLITLKQGEFDPAILPPMDAMTLLAKCIFKVAVTEEEEKN